MPGLFSHGASETLEVKLRLLPVARCSQSEFMNNMDRYRDLSKIIPDTFDPAAWTSFLQANPTLRETHESQRSSPCHAGNMQRSDVGMETLSHIMSQGLQPMQHAPATEFIPGTQHSHPCPTLAAAYSTPGAMETSGSAYGTSLDAYASHRLQHAMARPASQASARAIVEPGAIERRTGARATSMSVMAGREGSYDEGPSKKRACVTKSDWTGGDALGAHAESLRVAASSAASMRILRPVPVRPGASTSPSLQELPRQPTPRPGIRHESSGRPIIAARSRLSSETFRQPSPSSNSWPVCERSDLASPPVGSFIDDTRATYATNSPVDIASSPPTFHKTAGTAPSSPALPAFPLGHPVDSGFMSGPADGLPVDDDELRPVDQEDLEIAAQYSRRPPPPPQQAAAKMPLRMEHVTPGPPELLPRKILPRPAVVERKKLARAMSVVSSDPVTGPDHPLPLAEAPAPAPAKRGRGRPRRKSPAGGRGASARRAATIPPVQTPSVGPPVLPRLAAIDPSPALMQTPSVGPPVLPCLTALDSVGSETLTPAMDPPLQPASAPVGPDRLTPAMDPLVLPASDPVGLEGLPPAMERPVLPSPMASDLVGPEGLPPAMERPVLPSLVASDLVDRDGSAPRPATPLAAESTTGAVRAANCKVSRPRSGSGAKRKKCIAKRLEKAVLSGEMPPYCGNCGAIETPTWRKCWSKKIEGSEKDIRMSDDEGGITGIRDLEKDAEGRTISFYILKRTLVESDAGFLETLLCNPCGLWLQKNKGMRPQHAWEKEAKDPKDPNERRKRPLAKKCKPAAAADSTVVTSPPDEPMLPGDHAASGAGPAIAQHDGSTDEEPRQTKKPRSASAQGLRDTSGLRQHAVLLDRRGAQSSPVRALGTQLSPIELDDDADDLGSTRRILFPTPNKGPRSTALQELTTHAVNQRQAAPSALSTQENAVGLGLAPTPGSTSSDDKENGGASGRGGGQEDDELRDLFEDDGGGGGDGDDGRSSGPRTPRKTTRRRALSSIGSSPNSRSGRKSRRGTGFSPWRLDLLSSGGRRPRALRAPQTPGSGRNHHPPRRHNDVKGSRSPGSPSPAASQKAILPYSPFTSQMYQLLSQVNRSPAARTGLGHYPTTTTTTSMMASQPACDGAADGLLDFPSLPCLADFLHLDHDLDHDDHDDEDDADPRHDHTTTSLSLSLSSSSSSTVRLTTTTTTDLALLPSPPLPLPLALPPPPEDLFAATDLPWPSSPPPGSFAFYEHPAEPTSGLWSDFDDHPDEGGRAGPLASSLGPVTTEATAAAVVVVPGDSMAAAPVVDG
ncbi:MAG: hypothetical protein M1826_002301 [Phylliscum demangeonii]|nr:MAG: hypothetical protein M1826_002301 [Phylliscum demangeonii]